ncbi:SsrA-binding protein SmpB [Desulfohalobium retbaense]|uniref:SsrA-binding protein n=1 Tax=Desulfohalobium retbaense (strain ATCC 49708 / DSM 5692 / JCM 16813 / HR100) TaxID=485915 RepID=C8X4S5_DESRD|nr:SsrA-binding protein SmpB [Desulfohalobium retbaense]ACV69298.1 SsrA-binding protein [Desulfohalobium retbaense DSM 5692]
MSGIKVVAQNRKARHYFEFIEFIEAGLVLTGSEVKSLRAGRISFKDGYVQFRGGEAFLVGVHIAHYENAGYAGHDPDQPRKLLLHRREIASLRGKVEQKGLTMVPTKVYLKNGRFKVELALARGKNVRDRRQELKQKAIQRDMDREMAKAK